MSQVRATALCVLIFHFFSFHSIAQSDTTKQVLELEVVYQALPWFNAAGGLKQGFVYMDNADVTAKVNFDQLFNLEDKWSLFLYGLGNHGGRATSFMGDFQVASNIEAVRGWRLFEAWTQHNFNDERTSVLLGLYDLNSEFDILKPGTLFINSSFGIGAEYAQSGLNGPSIFPISAFAVRFARLIGRRLHLRMAVLDAVPGDPSDPRDNGIRLSGNEGALLAGEISIYTNSVLTGQARRDLERQYVTRRRKVGREHGFDHVDKINVGGWYYVSQFVELSDSIARSYGNAGVYIGLQKYFQGLSENQYIALFARLGFANSAFNRYGTALSGGVVFASPLSLPGHLGVGFSSGVYGSAFRQMQANNTQTTETALELTYAVPVAEWLTIQPDVQYIINPSTQQGINNALAFSLLIQTSFSAL